MSSCQPGVARRANLDHVAVVAAVLLFAAPAVIIPGGLNRFVFGKAAIDALGAGIAWWARSTGRLNRAVVIVLCSSVVVLGLAAVQGAAPLPALLGRSPRYEGCFILAVYFGAAAAGARLLGPERDDRVVVIGLRVLAAAAVVIALIAILEAFGLRPLSSSVSRPGSLLGNASDEGAFGVLALGPLAVVGLRRRDAWMCAAAAAAALTVVLSASRGAFGALLVELAVLAVVAGGRRTGAAAAIVGLAVCAFALVIPSTRSRILDESPLAHHTLSGRELLWSESLTLDAHRPLLGVGPSGFEAAIIGEHDLRWEQQVGPANPPDSPHDWLLQAASAGGLPLLGLAIVLSALVVAGGFTAARRERTNDLPLALGSLGAVIGYGVVLLVHLTSAGPTTLAAVLAGPLISQPPATPRRILDRVTGSALLAVAVVLALSAIAEIPLRHAILDLNRGDDEGAQRSFTTAHDLRPWDLDLSDLAGHAFVTIASTRTDPTATRLAATWLSKVTPSLRSNEQVQLDQASLDEARRQFPAAASILTHILSVDRDNPLVILRRGVVEGEESADSAAERDFRRVIAITPTSPDPWHDLAILYNIEGRTAAATQAQTRAETLVRSEG